MGSLCRSADGADVAAGLRAVGHLGIGRAGPEGTAQSAALGVVHLVSALPLGELRHLGQQSGWRDVRGQTNNPSAPEVNSAP